MKRVFFALIILASLYVCNSLVRSIFSLWQKNALLNNAQQELAIQKQENARLKAQLSYVKTAQFLEEQARDNLLLIKPNEQEIMLSQATSEADAKDPVVFSQTNLPPWKQWIKLFN